MISLELSTIHAKNAERAMLSSATDHFLRAGGSVITLPAMGATPPPRRYHPEPIQREFVRRRKPQKPPRQPLPSPHLARRLELLPQIVEMAKTMTAPEVARKTGIARTTLRTMAITHGFDFFVLPRPGAATPAEVETIRQLAAEHSVAEVARITGRGRRNLLTIGSNAGFTYRNDAAKGAQNLRKGLTPQQIARHAERLRNFAKIGLSRRRAAGLSGIGYRTFQRICADFNIEFGGQA